MSKTGNPICPVCSTPVESADVRTVCTSCKVTFHQECWQENKGCATYGCNQVNALNPPMKLDLPPAVPPGGVDTEKMLRQLAEQLQRGEINLATYQRIRNEILSCSPQIAPPLPVNVYHNIPSAGFLSTDDSYFGKEVILAWKNIGNEGRSRRRDYWMFLLYYVILFVVSFIAMLMVIAISDEVVGISDEAAGVLVFMWLIFAAVMFVPAFWLAVRRLHDAGNSGWWLLGAVLFFFPLSLVLLILALQDSVPGNNEWGPNPKGT